MSVFPIQPLPVSGVARAHEAADRLRRAPALRDVQYDLKAAADNIYKAWRDGHIDGDVAHRSLINIEHCANQLTGYSATLPSSLKPQAG